MTGTTTPVVAVGARVHGLLEPNVPGESLPKRTVPVGVLTAPLVVSDTVAWHVAACPTTTGDEVHNTDVAVERNVGV